MQAERRAKLAWAMLRRSSFYVKKMQAERRAKLAWAMLRRSSFYVKTNKNMEKIFKYFCLFFFYFFFLRPAGA
jgi:hypothetical protein